MFPRLALLPIGLFVIWCFVSHHWYVCHIKMACGTEEVVVPPPVDPPDEDTRPIVFDWDDARPITRPTFDALKTAKLAAAGDKDLLEIVGLYFPGETAPEGFANMGLARASRVAALFSPPLPPERIVETSRLISTVPDGIRGDTLFEAVELNTKSGTPVDTIEIIEVANTITILFPYGSSVNEPDPQVDAYLVKLAERLSQTDETVTITGHTDDAGSVAFNQQLGMARANQIKKFLVRQGVSGSRITTFSKGESEPVANNASEEGSRQNRRVVLVLNENQI